MAKEIERKFLVKNNQWRENASGRLYRQGYLSIDKTHVVRVRTVGSKGFLTIKGPLKNFERFEFEYEIPIQDAKQMLKNLGSQNFIEKIRYVVEYKGHKWEIDEFRGKNKGLILAEIELSSQIEKFEIPEWIAEEVTDDIRYYNSYLVQHPHTTW